MRVFLLIIDHHKNIAIAHYILSRIVEGDCPMPYGRYRPVSRGELNPGGIHPPDSVEKSLIGGEEIQMNTIRALYLTIFYNLLKKKFC